MSKTVPMYTIVVPPAGFVPKPLGLPVTMVPKP